MIHLEQAAVRFVDYVGRRRRFHLGIGFYLLAAACQHQARGQAYDGAGVALHRVSADGDKCVELRCNSSLNNLLSHRQIQLRGGGQVRTHQVQVIQFGAAVVLLRLQKIEQRRSAARDKRRKPCRAPPRLLSNRSPCTDRSSVRLLSIVA